MLVRGRWLNHPIIHENEVSTELKGTFYDSKWNIQSRN
jgi:hypothetical protein